MREFVSFQEAQELVLESVLAGPRERVTLAESLGRTLAEEVRAEGPLPPFDNSAMDGYAIRWADVQAERTPLPVTGEIAAGQWPEMPLAAGTAVRIMTGAPIPAGADTVVPVEWTADEADGEVTITRVPEVGQHVRRAGRDVPGGEVVFSEGEVITAPVVGMLAAVGRGHVLVSRRPEAAVVATGSELTEAGRPLRRGTIRNSNGPALAAQIRESGGALVGSWHTGDNRRELREVLERSRGADIIVVSGGVSVGKHDLVREVLAEAGIRHLLWRVRQRPGKPLAYGLLDETLVFGLPGNPVSSSVCFDQYVRPALARILGRRHVVRPRRPAILEQSVEKKGGLHYFVRGVASVREDGVHVVSPTGSQQSNIFSSVVKANCLVHLPEEWDDAPAGRLVETEYLTA
jgi:molybdopterin molybdotransferase